MGDVSVRNGSLVGVAVLALSCSHAREPLGSLSQALDPPVAVACDVPSLIAAINAANAAGVPTTLSLAAKCVYSLSAVDNNHYGPNGLPAIASDLTIVGNGATITRPIAKPPFRLFYVASTQDPYFATAGALTLQDVTLSGGLARGGVAQFGGAGGGAGLGGAIFNQGTTTLRRVTIASCSAVGADGGGGGSGGGSGGGGLGGQGGAGGFLLGGMTSVSGGAGGGGMGGSGGQPAQGNAQMMQTFGGGGGGGLSGNGGSALGAGGAGGGGDVANATNAGAKPTAGGGVNGGAAGAPNGGAGGMGGGGGGGSGSDLIAMPPSQTGNGGAGGVGGGGGAGGGGTGGSGAIGGFGGGGGGGGGDLGGAGGEGGGGGGGSGSAGMSGFPSSGGKGGFGGGGGGGGASGGGGSGGSGGGGGFGGGGGAAGANQVGANFGQRGTGGLFAGNGSAGITNASFTAGGGGGGAGLGGAVFSDRGGLLYVTSSTLTGNTAKGGAAGPSPMGGAPTAGDGAGSAIFALDSQITISGSTLAVNTSTGPNPKGAVYAYQQPGQAASLTLENTAIGMNVGASDCEIAGGASLVENGGNVVQVVGSCTFGASNVTGKALALSATLKDNGGPTQTLAPSVGSPVINAGIGTTCAGANIAGVDQRGLMRRAGPCDSGAFEAQPASLAIVSGNNQAADLSLPFAAPLVVRAVDAQGDVLGGVSVTFTAPALGASATFSNATSTITVVSDVSGVVSSGTLNANAVNGSYFAVATAPVGSPATFSLRNGPAPDGGTDAGSDAATDSGTPVDAGGDAAKSDSGANTDAGVVRMDAGTPVGTFPDASSDGSTGPDDLSAQPSGCGCRVYGNDARKSPVWLALAAVLAMFARRRRAR